MATAGGAANAGLADQVGTLTSGKQADIVLVDVARRPVLPPFDPVAAVTAFAGIGNVDTVLVAGKIKKRDGRLAGVDLDSVRDLVAAGRRRLLAGQP